MAGPPAVEPKGTAIVLHEHDNVATALQDMMKGTQLTLEGGTAITCVEDIPFGYKVALCDIDAGNVVIKYGVPIGMATKAIPGGSQVHSHNLKSLQGGSDNEGLSEG